MKYYEQTHHHDKVWEEFITDAIKSTGRGSFLEFGVADGGSAKFICKQIGERELHGFDWFRGLPEKWFGWEEGHFDTGGVCPIRVNNLRIFNGLFSDTLPTYLRDFDDSFAFVHIDCDLYSSTKTIFNLAAERFVSGTIIVFDEALWHRDFMLHEGLAFLEFARDFNKDFDVLSCTSDGQMAVRIK